jgi:hypothetical protein
VARDDWASLPAVDALGLATLSSKQRAILAEHWLEVAQLEHASIAAFARFALQLLSVGAPPRLLEATHIAMADETQHARLAFGLASAYANGADGADGAGALGPAALDCSGALTASTLEDIVLGTFLEGCIGETMAALSARESLEDCKSDAVRAVLEVIARDEAQHAELAWQFVAWALQQCPALGLTLKANAEQRLHDARLATHLASGIPSDEARSEMSRWQREHGAVPASARLAERALAEVVLPVLQAVCSRLTANSVAARVAHDVEHGLASVGGELTSARSIGRHGHA